MNKPELYELCKQLQDVIIKLQFDMNCLEEENIDLKEKLEDKTNRLTKLAEIHYEKYRDN